MDRISNLPEEIICQIGSFLSAKEAAFAMVLSKRWRNLFTIIPNLRFDHNNGESIMDFSDRVLALQATSRVRNFSIKWRFDDTEIDHIINRCLRHVLKLGVLDLELRRKHSEEEEYSSLPFPFEVFNCETVVKLTLGSGFVIHFLPENAYLPSLKTLCLDSIWFHEFGRCAFSALLSACPVLEELVMDGVALEHWKWSFTVSSPTLERLTIRRYEWENNVSEIESISLDTPALTYLEYADYVPKEYPFVNLSSLVEAKLDLRVKPNQIWDLSHAKDFNPLNLINGLKNIEILDTDIDFANMLDVFDEAIPVFENLFHISLTFYNFCWHSLPTLLKKSPNLKTLISNTLHYDLLSDKTPPFICECVSEYSFLSSCPVEVLKLTSYDGSAEELEQMKHILEKLSCLELLQVCAQVTGEERVRVLTDLLMLPRASTNCKIQVTFS